jgi:Leucine-rich repeat (LRR) protein
MSSLNPLENVCGDLHDLMLQHFNKSDILKVSEVSPEWNETISTSSKCMARIPLKFGWSVAVVPEEIFDSQRQYNDLTIESSFDEFNDISLRKFKVIAKFAPYLKNLKFAHGYGGGGLVFMPENLKFPKLESLNILVTLTRTSFIATKLKKLQVTFDCCNRETLSLIESQEKLEELQLNDMCNCLLEMNPKALKGIKKFECKFKYYKPLSIDKAAKFNKIMEPMCETLTYLKVEFGIFPVNIELIVNQMPKLKTLFLNNCVLKDLKKTKFISNSSIKELHIDEESIHEIKNLLFSLINLEVLQTNASESVIRFADFRWIARNLLKLRKLFCRFIKPYPERILERYDDLKATEEGINMDIEIVLLP